MKRRNPLAVGAIIVVALAILAFVVVLPRGREVARIETQITEAEAKVGELNAQLATLRGVNAASLAAEIALIRSQIPSTAALPDLLALLTAAAERAGVTLGGISIGGASTSTAASVSVIPVSLTADGGYFALARFVFELEHLDRLSRVSGISIAPTGERGLTLSLTAEVYTTDPSTGPGSAPEPGLEVGL